ncbi:MAG TPA: hypothetical protein VN635_09345 [Conexibacter sp.]|nr:hypothetical protein [Conexibacter sp.]
MADNVSVEQRIRAAVADAEIAFWQPIAAAFPEATTGDLDPHATVAFMDACTEVVRVWLDWNAPQLLGDDADASA